VILPLKAERFAQRAQGIKNTYPQFTFMLRLAGTFFMGEILFQTFEQAQQTLLEKSFEVTDLKFCDLWGRRHHLAIPASQFEPKLMEEGIGFDGSSVGLKSVKGGFYLIVISSGFTSTSTSSPYWISGIGMAITSSNDGF
jgi:hypothetical protein